MSHRTSPAFEEAVSTVRRSALLSAFKMRTCETTGGRFALNWIRRSAERRVCRLGAAMGAADARVLCAGDSEKGKYSTATTGASQAFVATVHHLAAERVFASVARVSATYAGKLTRARRTPPMGTMILILVALAIVFLLEDTLSYGISARLGAADETTARVVAFALAGVLPLAAHLVVLQMAPGRRGGLRAIALSLAAIGVLLLGVGGVFLRNRGERSKTAATTVMLTPSTPGNATSQTSGGLGDWVSENAGLIVFAGLFLLVAGVSVLLSLHHASRAAAAHYDPGRAGQIHARGAAVLEIANRNIGMLHELARACVAAYDRALRAGVHGDLADRLETTVPVPVDFPSQLQRIHARALATTTQTEEISS